MYSIYITTTTATTTTTTTTTTTSTATTQQVANNTESAPSLDPKLSYTYSDSSAGGGFGVTTHCTSSSGSAENTPTASVKKAVKSIEAALASKPNSPHNFISPASSVKHSTADTGTHSEVSPPPTTVLN